MNFTIEVPGDANPLDLQALYRTLYAATSSDNNQRQSAGQQLTSWEANTEYYPSLQTVFLDKTFPHEVRLLAILQLKNGLDKYWRHFTLKNAIQDAQKHLIRSRLFQGTVGEPDRQLALHNALVLARIVRIDFPKEWPDAMSSLVALLRTLKDEGNAAHLSGALLLVLRVVKELGTVRLLKSQKALQSVTPEFAYLLGEIYTASATTWIACLSSGQGDETDTRLAMENSLTAFKTLRRLLIVGYDQPHKDQIAQQAWALSQTHFDQFLKFVSHDSPVPGPYLDIVGKHLAQFTKLHVEMANAHPASFAAFPSSFDLVRAYWALVDKFAQVFDKSGGPLDPADTVTRFTLEGPLLEKLALKGLLLVRSCIRMANLPQQSIQYRSREVKEEQTLMLQHVKTDLLKDELIVQVANVIISNLLVFRKADLDAWEEDPEEWEQQEHTESNAWEWEVRPCAENVLQHLLVNYKSLLMQPLLAYFSNLKNPQASIMEKEAIYTALGLAAAHINEQFDFNELLRSTITSDAQQQGPTCNVLRRRIGILISQWVPIGVDGKSRPLIYEIYRHFLNSNDPTNDVVVRITAARQFKTVAEDFAFDGVMFQPFAEGILTELIGLLRQVDVDESKLAILGTTKLIIERMETHVTGFADLVISALPSIWESAGPLGFMLKQSVLTILQSLVVSMKGESIRYHSIILPLIREAVQVGSDVFLYLIDEALELWENILSQSSPPLSQDVLALAEPAIQMLESVTENHLPCLRIVGSYIILAPEAMLEDQIRRPLLSALSASFTTKSYDQISTTTKYTESYIRLAQELGGIDGLKLVVQDMMASNLLPSLYEGIHDAYLAHQTTGPNGRSPKIRSLTLTDFFGILSRIAVADPVVFVETLLPFGPLPKVWAWLSAEWFASFDCMADDARRKLCLLGLTRLLELPDPVVVQELVLAKLQDYLSMWTSIMHMIIDVDQSPCTDIVVLTEPLGTTEWDTPKDLRQRALIMTDPVRCVHVVDFVQERLGALVQRVGGERIFQDKYLADVDADVLQGFQAVVKAGGGGAHGQG